MQKKFCNIYVIFKTKCLIKTTETIASFKDLKIIQERKLHLFKHFIYFSRSYFSKILYLIRQKILI